VSYDFTPEDKVYYKCFCAKLVNTIGCIKNINIDNIVYLQTINNQIPWIADELEFPTIYNINDYIKLHRLTLEYIADGNIDITNKRIINLNQFKLATHSKTINQGIIFNYTTVNTKIINFIKDVYAQRG
jgi:hypothetical protein